MLIGYARTSTIEQVNGLDAQIDQLKALGCEKIFSEQVSSISKRPELMKSVDFCREGDIFVATKLDRLARSVQDLWKLVETLDRKDVHLRVLDIGIDTSAPTGRLILTVLGGISQFKREIMLERQREGIARAKAVGKYKGRKPTARQKARDVLALRQDGLRPQSACANSMEVTAVMQRFRTSACVVPARLIYLQKRKDFGRPLSDRWLQLLRIGGQPNQSIFDHRPHILESLTCYDATSPMSVVGRRSDRYSINVDIELRRSPSRLCLNDRRAAIYRRDTPNRGCWTHGSRRQICDLSSSMIKLHRVAACWANMICAY